VGVVKKTGILGGTFDPIHIGHLTIAKEIIDILGIKKVVFLPASKPRLREETKISPPGNRLEMIKLAIEGKENIEVSDIELKRQGITYTIETLRELKLKNPDDQIYFILGWDNLEKFPLWKESSAILKLAKIVAVPRIGYPVPDLVEMEQKLPGLKEGVILLDKPEIDISSSVIRERVRLGLPIDHLVPESVANYIQITGLYK
jgi:nicotinate-nucleotide adenylyltransferase